ncbi:MAG: S9 family peptidase [Actinomycetota bacterium]|nr:S9 family peptidase [Actinomycetota bacterium]
MPFDLDTFLALPRVAGLALSPDGTRLVTSVATLAPDGKRFTTALWQLDPAGEAPPFRLTRSTKGESAAAFLPDGSVLFTSARPDPGAKPKPDGQGDDERAGLWLLPVVGGEARLVADPPAGVDGLAVAREAGTVALGVGVFPGAETLEEDEQRFTARKEAGVKAQLFETYPIRNWDHYLGPRERRLFVADPPELPHDGRLGELRPVAADAGHGLDDMDFDLTPDGSTLVTGWRRHRDIAADLVAVATGTGERRVLGTGDVAHYGVRCSPDGRFVVCAREVIGTPERAHRAEFLLVDLETGHGRDPAPGLELDPTELAWAPDSSAVFFVADERGRAPVFRLDMASGSVTRLSAAGAFSDLCASPDGTTVYALRSTPLSPPQAVALDATAADQEPEAIPTPGLPSEVPGKLEELTATAADGTTIRSWLLLPREAGATAPAPLVVWIHGGPRGSWNSAWHWRWNPHLLVERGYAVLMPDPALSTGYGQPMLERGWGRWGDEPYTDVMASVDAALDRPDLDESRTAAMGGSFGGYMANWVAGHTDRFRCIVTHASLWALDQFHGTTDHGLWWEREFGDPYEDLGGHLRTPGDLSRYEAHSPHRHVGKITTPMLVIHGELDHRVPVGEALRLWTDLSRHGVEAKFLYFPDENHWVLKPQHARIWYETVFAWLDHHLLGKEWERPNLL